MVFNAVQLAQVTASGPTGAVAAAGVLGVPTGPALGLLIGGQSSGLYVTPDLGDLLIVAKDAGGNDVVLAGWLDPENPPSWVTTTNPGDLVIGNSAGASIQLLATGDIKLVPASGRTVLLGAAGAVVARVGDPVSGTAPSGGGAITASIASSTSEVKA